MKYFSEETLLESIDKNAVLLFGEETGDCGDRYVNIYSSEISGSVDSLVNYLDHDYFSLEEIAICMKHEWWGTYGDCLSHHTKTYLRVVYDALELYLNDE